MKSKTSNDTFISNIEGSDSSGEVRRLSGSDSSMGGSSCDSFSNISSTQIKPLDESS